MTDYLAAILERKRAEIRRRLAHVSKGTVPFETSGAEASDGERGARAVQALRRAPGGPPRVIAEVKFRSPSAGVIRARGVGDVAAIARAYERGGAAAVSVLADGPGFGGSPLDVRRAAGAVAVPILFKEFVLDPVQVDLAHAMGASLVLLLVRALEGSALDELVRAVRARGMEPVVEAASAPELDRALATGATIVGMNARDLRTFEVDVEAAAVALAAVPRDRIAVFMSGIHDAAGLARVAGGRADAVLVGEGLMRAPDPCEKLRGILHGQA